MTYDKDDMKLWKAENLRSDHEKSIFCPHCNHRGTLRLAFQGKKALPNSKCFIRCACNRLVKSYHCTCGKSVPIDYLFEYVHVNSKSVLFSSLFVNNF